MFDTRCSVKDAAEFHSVSEKTIRRWIQQGILPAERVGPKLIRIDPTEMHLLSKPVTNERRTNATRKNHSIGTQKKSTVARLIEPWQPSMKRGLKKRGAAAVSAETAPVENPRP